MTSYPIIDGDFNKSYYEDPYSTTRIQWKVMFQKDSSMKLSGIKRYVLEAGVFNAVFDKSQIAGGIKA